MRKGFRQALGIFLTQAMVWSSMDGTALAAVADAPEVAEVHTESEAAFAEKLRGLRGGLDARGGDAPSVAPMRAGSTFHVLEDVLP